MDALKSGAQIWRLLFFSWIKYIVGGLSFYCKTLLPILLGMEHADIFVFNNVYHKNDLFFDWE